MTAESNARTEDDLVEVWHGSNDTTLELVDDPSSRS